MSEPLVKVEKIRPGEVDPFEIVFIDVDGTERVERPGVVADGGD